MLIKAVDMPWICYESSAGVLPGGALRVGKGPAWVVRVFACVVWALASSDGLRLCCDGPCVLWGARLCREGHCVLWGAQLILWGTLPVLWGALRALRGALSVLWVALRVLRRSLLTSQGHWLAHVGAWARLPGRCIIAGIPLPSGTPSLSASTPSLSSGWHGASACWHGASDCWHGASACWHDVALC